MTSKRFCDRCGKEIPEGANGAMEFQGRVYYNDRPQVKMKGDLCRCCTKSFEEWVQNLPDVEVEWNDD